MKIKVINIANSGLKEGAVTEMYRTAAEIEQRGLVKSKDEVSPYAYAHQLVHGFQGWVKGMNGWVQVYDDIDKFEKI